MRKLFDRKHLPTVIAMSVPVIFMLVLVFVLYVPGLFVRPQYDFIYTDKYNSGYTVENGKIVQQTTDVWFPNRYGRQDTRSTLYRYSVKDNKSHEISFSEAQKLTIDPSSQSPDGFKWNDPQSSGSWPFFLGDSSSAKASLKGKGATYQLKGLEMPYYSVEIIGWVTGE